MLRYLLATVLATVLANGVAWAYWTAGSGAGGRGASAAAAVSQGATPTATASGADVTVTWTPSTLSSGQAVSGYTIKRYSGSTAQTIATSCTGTITATTCTENAVPAGSWTYTVTPVFATWWVGTESGKSSAAVVASAPVAVADSYSVNEDTPLTIAPTGVLANDTDTQGDPLTAILASGVANGALTFNADGGFTYTPKPGFNGSDSFAYRADDGTEGSNTVTVTVAVTAVNDAPVNAVPGPQQTPKNTGRVFSTANNNPISISDADAGGATVRVQLTGTNGTVTLPVLTGLTFTVGDGTADATMTFTGTIATINLRLGGATFIPTTGFTGAATLQVVTSDLGSTGTGGALTDTDAVTINVNALGIFTANQDINAPGSAGSSTYSAGTYTVKGGGADVWLNADQIQFAHRSMTGNGRLTARVVSQVQTPSAEGSAKAGVMFRSTLAPGSIHGFMDIMQSNGSEFLWRLTTNGGSGTNFATTGIAAPYWVRITRVGDVVTTDRSVNGTTWVLQGTQTIVLGPTISVGLAVNARDNTKLNTATFDNVALTTPPTAVTDAYSTNEDTTLSVGAPGPLANDTDPESDDLTATLVSGTTGLTLNADGSFAYVPPANFTGAASFTYKTNDGVFDSNTVTVNLTVNPANEVPSFTKGANQSVSQVTGAQSVTGWATAISQGTGESGQLVDFVVTNDNNPLFSVQPAVSATGTLTYTPAGATGVATVSVTIHDNGGTAYGGSDLSAVQTFTITLGDGMGPTGGSVDASGLVGTGPRYAASTTLSLVLAKGTDPSGVATTGNLLKRATATLTSGGIANGTCGTFGSYSLVSGGTDPVSPTSDAVADQACYRYQYVVLDTLGNPTTYTSPDIKVDLTAPAAPTLAHSAFTNTSWSSGPVVYYRSAAASGSFTTTSTATDSTSGIASHTFPPLGASWTSTPGPLGVNTYSWSGAPAAPGAKNVTATNNATGVSAATSFTPTADDTAPSAGTVTPPNTTQTSTSVSVAYTTGTDGGSGLGTRLLQRQSATLTGTTCGSYGGWTTVATNPGSSPVGDTVAAGFCYRYQYVVSDNVGNTHTATSGNVVKVSSTYAQLVAGKSGLLSYWRLGEATTSSDSFSGSATGSDLSAHTGEIGATWTLWQNPAPRGLITSEGRLRRNNVTGGVGYLSSTAPAGPDYLVEADVHVKSVAQPDDIGILGRVVVGDAADIGTNYLVRYHLTATVAQWELRSNVNSVGTLLASYAQPLTAGSTYRVGLDLNGSTIRLLVDGEVRATVTDTSTAGAGRTGVRLGASSASAPQSDTVGMHLDNFRVAPPLTDSKGTNSGDYVGGPTLGNTGAVAGDANTAAQFDGVNDYGSVARQIGDDFSIELWFRSTQSYGATCTQWWQGAGLLDADSGGLNNDFGLSLCQGKVIGGVGGTSEVSVVSPATYNNGAWHHVVFTRTKATGALALYVDGAAAGTATGGTTSLTAQAGLSFGRIATGVQYFAGSLDEIAVYTSVLSAADASAHYAAAQ